MNKINTKIGDVFVVKINKNEKKYFQLIAFDLTQLNSDVIRVFKEIYKLDDQPSLFEITEGAVDFYSHCVTKWGIKSANWEFVGNINNLGNTENILFRDSSDYGNPDIKVSNNWWIWRIGKKQVNIGKLTREFQSADIGIVFDAESIVHRMKTGEYDGVYPDYERDNN